VISEKIVAVTLLPTFVIMLLDIKNVILVDLFPYLDNEIPFPSQLGIFKIIRI